MKSIGVIAIFVLFSVKAFAGSCGDLVSQGGGKNSNFLVKVMASPMDGELLDPEASSQQVEPWFHPNNPLTQDVPLTFMRHKFASAFTFSADGKYVIIHHDIFPDAEQLTLRSLDTGENLSSLLWRGKGGGLFDLRSVDFDGQSRRIVGLAENFHTDGSDSVAIWDGRNDNVIENIRIQKAKDNEYRPVVRSGHNHSFRTAISQSQPYYVRTNLRSSEKESSKREYSAQIIDWQNKHSLNLSFVAVDFLRVISEPFNVRFRYAALLQDNEKDVQLISFDEITRRMIKTASPAAALLGEVRKISHDKTKTPGPGGFMVQIRRTLQGLIGIKPQKNSLALLEPSTNQQLATDALPEFGSLLVHDQPVTKAVLSKWAPFVVTKTESGLHVWNAITGDKIESINTQVRDFRVLEQIGLLAYVDSAGDLILYSILKGSQVAKFSGFTYFYLNSHLENFAPGLAHITLDNGSVMQVTETILDESGVPVYDIVDTGLRLKIPLNRSYRTVIETRKGKYLLQIHEFLGEIGGKNRKLVIDIFALDGSGKQFESLNFPILAFQPQFELDPTGKTVVYTPEETKTGILHLERLLEDQGL